MPAGKRLVIDVISVDSNPPAGQRVHAMLEVLSSRGQVTGRYSVPLTLEGTFPAGLVPRDCSRARSQSVCTWTPVAHFALAARALLAMVAPVSTARRPVISSTHRSRLAQSIAHVYRHALTEYSGMLPTGVPEAVTTMMEWSAWLLEPGYYRSRCSTATRSSRAAHVSAAYEEVIAEPAWSDTDDTSRAANPIFVGKTADGTLLPHVDKARATSTYYASVVDIAAPGVRRAAGDCGQAVVYGDLGPGSAPRRLATG